MTTLADYHHALRAALDDDRYQWHTPLGDLLQEDVRSTLRYPKDIDMARASVERVIQYQLAVGIR